MTFKHSIVHRIAVVIGAIAVIALTNMVVSLMVANSIQGSATAINVSGSLRMHAYALLSRYQQDFQDQTRGASSRLQQELSEYDERIEHTGLTSSLPSAADHPLRRQYLAILERWHNDVRPALLQPPLAVGISPAVTRTEALTSEINELVRQLEDRTEARVRLMHLIQMISLVLTVLTVIFLFFDLKRRIIRPLGRLVAISGAVASKDFSRKASLSGGDELSQLGRAFDQMTTELGKSYQQLETEALLRTRELERSHAALELLHRASRSLFANHDLCDGAVPMLQELEQILGIGPIRLYLHDRNFPEPVQAVTTATLQRPDYCRDHDCDACLVAPIEYDELPSSENDGRRLLLPIRTPGHLLGTLEVWYPAHETLPESSRRLLETLSDQLATAIYLEKQITEEQQLNLAEERAIIARELHDSLAQSLSYLKMQVARLRRLPVSGEQKPAHDEVLDELSGGLSTAYRQLRELLTTFRLKLDTPDLSTALRRTVDEFSERLNRPVHLNFTLPPQTLSPNEEIHTLQIVREGLANAVKHADASEILVDVSFESPQVKVKIQDNGSGLPEQDQPLQHYGLIIMQDRARTLGGRLSVDNRDSGGVEVSLVFVPKSRHLITTNEPAQ